MWEKLLAKLDEVLCPNNRILGLMKRIQQALSPRGVTSTTSDNEGEAILSTDTDTILERWDEVVLQLKRTHLHLFLLTGFDGIEIDPGLVIKPRRHRLIGAAAVEDDDLADLLHVRDEKAANTGGGTFTQGDWRTRTLNTVVTNEISGASLASDQITLPAGTYEITAYAPAYRCGRHKAKLRDTTNTTDLIIGSSQYSTANDGPTPTSDVHGRFTLSGEVVLELQHQCAATRADLGFGVESNFSVVEVYAEVMIKKIS